jgi:adenylate kinase
VIGPEHSSPFSTFASAKVKFLLLGQSGPHFAGLVNQGRSLNLEHVSPALLVQQEISRRTPTGQQAAAAITRGSAVPDQLHLALLRKWFWARKPDAGFLLEGFPATLLQALVFDEWLEARGETLTAVLSAHGSSADLSSVALAKEDPVITHYRTQGLLYGDLTAAA